jgi:hypothetical protein
LYIPLADPKNLTVAATTILAHVVRADVEFLGAVVAYALAVVYLGVAKRADHVADLFQQLQKRADNF